MKKAWQLPIFLLVFLLGLSSAHSAESNIAVPILVYHRMGPVVVDSMTVKTSDFASLLEYLRTNDYKVIPLRQLVSYLAGDGPAPPARAVVITADDGHESVYTEMFPLIRRYHVPVTLFIYPSAISNASYAMTWPQLREMQDSGLVDIESHTYWHPNFNKEKIRLEKSDYQKFVTMQLAKSKITLEQKLDKHVDMLAWPFGIYDDELIEYARSQGYIAGFTLQRRPAERTDNPLTLPRYLMTDQVRYEKLLTEVIHANHNAKSKP